MKRVKKVSLKEEKALRPSDFQMWHDPSTYPRSKEAYRKVLKQETEAAANSAYQRGCNEQQLVMERSLEYKQKLAKQEGVAAVIELAKQLNKMAYFVMMTLNGDKPFGGGGK